MYLRTPKRYRSGNRRSLISTRRLLVLILLPLLIFLGLQIYDNRDLYGPPIQQAIYNVVGQMENSMATAQAPTPLPTQDPGQRIIFADSEWSRGAIEAAVTEYQGLIDAIPNDVEAHYRITLGLLMEGQTEQALDAAERTVTANPFSSDAWAIRAMALDWAGRPGEAIASALHALELDAENARAMAFLAEAYLDAGQGERALDTVNEALELDPASFEAYRVRGLILQSVEFDFDAARADYQQAYDLAPNLPYLAIDLAIIDSALLDTEAAIETLSEVIELNPGNTRALYLIASYYYRDQGSPNQALDYLTRCVEANPDSVSCHYMLGRVQIALDQVDLATESLEAAISLGTTDPFHYWWAGRVQIIQGNCSAAIPYLQTGYPLARESENADLITTYEDSLRECQALPALAEATEEATEEPVTDES